MQPFTLTVEPRFCETDALGHINNTALPVWFEQGRTPIFRIFNPELSLDHWNLILKKMDVEFVAQLHMGAPVEIRTSVFAVGNSSVTLLQEAWQNHALAARGHSVLVHFDYQKQRKADIPSAVREQLLALQTG